MNPVSLCSAQPQHPAHRGTARAPYTSTHQGSLIKRVWTMSDFQREEGRGLKVAKQNKGHGKKPESATKSFLMSTLHSSRSDNYSLPGEGPRVLFGQPDYMIGFEILGGTQSLKQKPLQEYLLGFFKVLFRYVPTVQPSKPEYKEIYQKKSVPLF